MTQPTDMQNLGTVIAMGETIRAVLPMIVSAAIIGIFLWACMMTWMARSAAQRLKNGEEAFKRIEVALGALAGTVEKGNDKLEEHRREDAKSFGALEERSNTTQTFLDHIDFWRKTAQDRQQLS